MAELSEFEKSELEAIAKTLRADDMHFVSVEIATEEDVPSLYVETVSNEYVLKMEPM